MFPLFETKRWCKRKKAAGEMVTVKYKDSAQVTQAPWAHKGPRSQRGCLCVLPSPTSDISVLLILQGRREALEEVQLLPEMSLTGRTTKFSQDGLSDIKSCNRHLWERSLCACPMQTHLTQTSLPRSGLLTDAAKDTNRYLSINRNTNGKPVLEHLACFSLNQAFATKSVQNWG
jgi:hypothetical protein